MNAKEINEYFIKLNRIMSGQEIEDNKNKVIRLRELATKIGASTVMYRAAPANADETELVKNILSSLQSASMVDTARTANKNYKIAFIAAISAAVSAIAAWAAFVVAIYYK